MNKLEPTEGACEGITEAGLRRKIAGLQGEIVQLRQRIRDMHAERGRPRTRGTGRLQSKQIIDRAVEVATLQQELAEQDAIIEEQATMIVQLQNELDAALRKIAALEKHANGMNCVNVVSADTVPSLSGVLLQTARSAVRRVLGH